MSMINIPIEKEFSAYIASPNDDKEHPAIILIHEVWGLTDHMKDVAGRFAQEGYIVLAPDLISQTGITEKVDQKILAEVKNPVTRDEAQKKLREAMAPIMSPEFARITVEKLKASVDFLLQDKKVNGKIGVVSFCFGGTYSYSLAIKDDMIQAAVPFYGQPPSPIDETKNITCPILAFYGEKDQNLMGSLPDLENKMREYGKDFAYQVYPDTGHAFFNDTNPTTYNKKAASDSWEKTLEFLHKNLRSS